MPSSLSSSSPSAIDSLFLRRGVDQKSTFQGRVGKQLPANGGSKTNNSFRSTQPRPRRLPTLIKILVGIGDERSASATTGSNNSVIARIERPNFVVPQVAKQRSGSEPMSHEDTVQIAAAAAAASIWSKSMRLHSDNRMKRVNSEWDAALSWIAGWEHHQQLPPSATLDGGNDDNADPPRDQDGYDTFVDDLARLLENCIKQCIEDEHFETRVEKGEPSGPGDTEDSFSIGNLVLRSFFGWFVRSAFPMVSFGKQDMISPESRVVMARAFQFVASSVALYALHSLWVWASPTVSNWYSSLGYTESPEWLIEHEKELKQAKKTSKSRQKKKKRKQQLARRSGGRSKVEPIGRETQKESRIERRISEGYHLGPDPSSHAESAPEPGLIAEEKLSSTSPQICASETAVQTSKDCTESQVSSTTDDIPSVISLPTTPASSSASFKPTGSHLEDRDSPSDTSLQGPPGLRLNTPLSHNGTLFAQKALPVPTQEQRNEAAKQLREFQNAQIQRLLLQKKLSQNSCAPAPQAQLSHQSYTLTSGGSFHSVATSSTASAGHRTKVLRPPPGLSHPAEEEEVVPPSIPTLEEDKAFLADNELLLSKLLEDDEDDADDMKVPPSLQVAIEAMSPESSLDPSAAPFVSAGRVTSPSTHAVAPKDDKGDGWQSPTTTELLKEGSPVSMKGVYGGSVW